MSNSSSQDFGIPVLTEVIPTPPRVVHAEATSTAVDSNASDPAAHKPIDSWLDEEWSRMEQKISERVLTQLLERIEPVLEQRIKDSLAQVMQLAAEGIKQDLHQTLADAISDAVAQEVDKIHFSNKQNNL
ncbi:Hypothetical protein mma_0668 [Janthinobacterium sp. Marseille]|nr:hypothetical protein [Janthinobacterium sp. Marseille]ABR91127.1 Hypothetical protein mma_0668 [Janthinobacterium sp. Marseille]